MKSINALVFLALLSSCVPAQKTTVVSSSASGDPNAPSKWNASKFPITLKLSSDFSNSEKTAIDDMAQEWESSIGNALDFFTIDSSGITDKGNAADLNSLYDSVYGVYKSTNWNPELPSTALAVTQIFGNRKNIGSVNEYVDIIHADILVNYDGFTFTTISGAPGYDLQSVMLHEMGHFLGLAHVTSVGHNSIMYPSIGSTDEYRIVLAYDINTIETRYGINGAMSAVGSMAISNDHTESSKPDEFVRIIHEIHDNGLCVHKVNGVQVYEHPHHLKK